MDFRIYDFMKDKVIVECEYMYELLGWLNVNYIELDKCYIQYYDGDLGDWNNFEY